MINKFIGSIVLGVALIGNQCLYAETTHTLASEEANQNIKYNIGNIESVSESSTQAKVLEPKNELDKSHLLHSKQNTKEQEVLPNKTELNSNIPMKDKDQESNIQEDSQSQQNGGVLENDNTLENSGIKEDSQLQEDNEIKENSQSEENRDVPQDSQSQEDNEIKENNQSKEDSDVPQDSQSQQDSEGQEEEHKQEESHLNEDDTYNSKENQVVLTLNSMTAYVGQEKVDLLAPPKVVNNTTLLPLRFVGEQVVEAHVKWDNVTKVATLTKEDTVVEVKLGSKIAYVDGLPCELLTEPIIENNTILVPLRFISEAFSLKIDFNNQTKEIRVHKPIKEEKPNQKPIAQFNFESEYIAGQVVKTNDKSFDPDGDKIIAREWSVLDNDRAIIASNLSSIFRTPRAGEYVIGLRVQDEKESWSDWYYTTITIKQNKAPIITQLVADKVTYAQGESIKVSYTYDNEEWESIKEGKWTYRKSTEPSNRAALGKPEVLFSEGEYIIALYLDDAYGNRSEVKELRITVTDEVKDTELSYRFNKGKIGDWIDNFESYNYLNYKNTTISEQTYRTQTLILSDSPENVISQGILYRDHIDGEGRLVIHHINNMVAPVESQKLVVTVENNGEEPIIVTLKNKSIKGPATDILRVGQLSLNEYLGGKVPDEVIMLEPGERKYIYQKNWGYDTCISGHMDVVTTGPTLFTVANLNSSQTLYDLDNIHYFPSQNIHPGGTYGVTGIHYKMTLDGNEPEKLLIGSKDTNEWVLGYDERTQNSIKNVGNFGVSYYITVTAEEDMGVILNNRGGVFQGSIKWNDEVHNMPGRGTFIGTTTKAVVMGVIKKGETVTIEYLLPNGSASPTLIGFIPKSMW